MNNKTVFLLFCFALFGLYASSCKRDDPKTIISGRVTEYGTNDPIQNAKVYVLCHSGGIFDPIQNGNLYDTLFTDNDGRFYREYLDKNLCGAAYLAFYKPGYFFHGDVDLSNGEENYFEVVLDPEAWLEIVTVPDGGIEHLLIRGDFYGASIEIYSTDGIQKRLFETKGSRFRHLHWRQWEEPNDDIKYDSVYVSAHDTTIYTIHY
ncbi:MAG: hypothetical protein JNJ57_12675 [Saprospiraceae bacterium]|nr:hypothetical protein [Saprospiraceae bacterium]